MCIIVKLGIHVNYYDRINPFEFKVRDLMARSVLKYMEIYITCEHHGDQTVSCIFIKIYIHVMSNVEIMSG